MKEFCFQRNSVNGFQAKNYFLAIIVIALVCICGVSDICAQETQSPIVVDADVMEYSTDHTEATASGNVIMTYQDSKLTCDQLLVNFQTKDSVASGNVRLEDERGVVKAQEMVYNFDSRTGRIIEGKIYAAPYFGKGDTIDRVSENRFDVNKGYLTTCNYDHPHFGIFSKKIEYHRKDKVRSKNDIVYVGGVPILYLPAYTHNLKDRHINVELTPGRKKDWGSFMLSSWRYNLNDYMTARIYLDYRQRLGLAEGFGLNYNSPDYGKGDYKFYYTQERPRRSDEGMPAEFQRYLIRWRHMWNLRPTTRAIVEYYKIVDSKMAVLGSEHNFLKDYFEREYEKDEQPKSYLLLNHAFRYANLNLLVDKRTNRWYSQTEKLPEASFSLPSFQLGDSPFYFDNEMMFSNLNTKNAVPSPSSADISVSRLDTYNKLSLPMRISFIKANPFAGIRETFYNKDINGTSLWDHPRTVFYSGVEMSTKFYRLFDISSNLFGMDINKLRHVISPIVQYAYNHEPTIEASELKQFDSVDSITRSNKVSLELENKLQTKNSKNRVVDLAIFRVTTDYIFKPKGGIGSNFSDFLFDLELLPYAWLRLEADAAYDHLGDNFKTINFDAYANFGKDRSFGIGHRYERKGGKELTMGFNWRLNPKWKFRVYERYQFSGVRRKGLKEQEYSISRDLHCWTVDLTYNVKKEEGETVWLVFRLKAFPELEFGFDQSYHEPKSGY